MSKARTIVMTAIIALGCGPYAQAANKEASVCMGEDGKLKYTPDDRGNLIPDFSRAGYMGGGVKIPDVPVKLTLEPSGLDTADDTVRIQKAIDDVGAMALDENGFRGAVLLKRGTYRISKTLLINHSGVVLRGEGQKSDGTIIIAGPFDNVTWETELIGIHGSPRKRIFTRVQTEGMKRMITDKYVPFGVLSFNVESTVGYSVGDQVILYRPSSKEWISAIGMDKIADKSSRNWTVGESHLLYDRTITAIKGNRITLDAPVMQAMEDTYGGGWIDKYTLDARISKAAIENMQLVTGFFDDPIPPKGRPETAVYISTTENGWARNISCLGISLGIRIEHGSRFCTVQDIAYLDSPRNKGGGQGYPVQVSRGQYNLLQRCYTRNSRRPQATGGWAEGPNVFLDCMNEIVAAKGGPHVKWATGTLYDNVAGARLGAGNQGSAGSGQGWTGALQVFWNCPGGVVIEQPPTSANFAFGTTGPHDPHAKRVEPRSLYLKQLEERLGKQAVENVTIEAQRTGPISDLLKEQFLDWETVLRQTETYLAFSQKTAERAQRRLDDAIKNNAKASWMKKAESGVKGSNQQVAAATAILAEARAQIAKDEAAKAEAAKANQK